MPRANVILNVLNAGEWSPRLMGRADMDKYPGSMSRLENFVLYPHGGAASRPGWRYMAAAKHADKAARLVPFVYSNVQAYILEFGDLYIRVFKDGGLVEDPLSPGDAYEVVTPYTAAELDQLIFLQRADILYIIQPDQPARKLTRLGHDSWTLTAVDWRDGPYLDQNTRETLHITPSATTGESITLTADYRYDGEDFGTWGLTPGTATELFSAANPVGGISFTAPTGGALSKIEIQLVTGASVEVTATAKLFAAADLTTVLATSEAVSLFDPGVKAFSFLSAPTLVEDSEYWIAFISSDTDEDVTVATVADSADYGSGRAATAAALTDDLGADWRAEIYYRLSGAASLWEAGHVGALWSLKHRGQKIRRRFETKGEGPAGKFRGKFQVNITPRTPDPNTDDSISINEEYWEGRLKLQRSSNQVTWDDVAVFWGAQIQEFFEDEFDVFYRVICDQYSSGKCITTIQQTECWGVVRITGFVSGSEVTAQVLGDLGGVTATAAWKEGAWSDVRGYPGAAMFQGNRFQFGGTRHQPTTRWATWVNDYENLTPSDTDDSPFTLTHSELKNRITWMMADEAPLIGTLGEEARLVASKQAPESQTNPATAIIQSHRGSAQHCQPVSVGSAVVYLDRSRRKLLESSYDLQSDKLVPVDLSLFAEHITAGGVGGMAYQQNPDSVIWATRDEWYLGLTYYRSENVIGWHRHKTDGVVESLACIPSTLGDAAGHDELWALIRRTVGGNTVRYVERLADNEQWHAAYTEALRDLEDAQRDGDATAEATARAAMLAAQCEFFCVDCGITYRGAATSTITGLDHLEGETVSILADGMVCAPQVVSGGEITLEIAASLVHVGLPYTALLQTQRLEAGASAGTAQGRMKKITELILRLMNSLGGKYYAIPTDVREIEIWAPDVQLMDQAPVLLTGDTQPIAWSGEWEREGRITIMQDQPLPMVVLAILATVVTND